MYTEESNWRTDVSNVKKRLESIIKCGGGKCTGYPPKGVETLFCAFSATDGGDGTAGHQLQACSPVFGWSSNNPTWFRSLWYYLAFLVKVRHQTRGPKAGDSKKPHSVLQYRNSHWKSGSAVCHPGQASFLSSPGLSLPLCNMDTITALLQNCEN